MTYKKLLELGAALLNDTDRAVYNDTIMLPYLNIARMELEEIFELNGIPVTNEQSLPIAVPLGTTTIGFGTTNPHLPDDLVEIQRVWESQNGQNYYTPMTKKEFLSPDNGAQFSSFGVWAWEDQAIKVHASIVDMDIKIDYIQSLFTFVDASMLNSQNSIRNTSSYLFNRVAGLCAQFVMHDNERAMMLNSAAGNALSTSLGISIKGKQIITTRRRPFRASYKARRGIA